jgi:hypothetical protein
MNSTTDEAAAGGAGGGGDKLEEVNSSLSQTNPQQPSVTGSQDEANKFINGLKNTHSQEIIELQVKRDILIWLNIYAKANKICYCWQRINWMTCAIEP